MNCDVFGGEELNPTYYETAEQDQIDDSNAHFETVESVEEYKVEIPKRKIVAPPRKSAVAPSPRIITPQGVQRNPKIKYEISFPPEQHSSHRTQSPSPSYVQKPAKRSRFEDVSRVWERKLSELPLGPALQLEKTINDLFYEAAVANLHQENRDVVKVDIGPSDAE